MEPSPSIQLIQVSPSLENILRVGVVFFQSLSIREESQPLRQTIEVISEELRRSIGDRPISQLDPVKRSRRVYKRVGIDPTKERPSSERLLRRVMRKLSFPRVNTFVDAMNLVSLRLQFPMGFYDWDRVAPPVLVRIGQPDEGYQGFGKDQVHLQGKIVLVDGEGPFGNPSRDSERTLVSIRTVRAMVMAFAPQDTPRAAFEEFFQETAAAVEEHCDGKVSTTGVLPP